MEYWRNVGFFQLVGFFIRAQIGYFFYFGITGMWPTFSVFGGNVTENVKKWFFYARHGWREATTNISEGISFFLLKAARALSIFETI